jgi:NAD-dependent dihydropyrimidine dehydrogenase PreA subunit
MAFWFLRGLARHVVTTKYPAVVDPWTAALPTPPSFLPARLTDEVAGRLVEICPSGALWQEGGELVLDVGACTACGACQRLAPDAVRPSGVFELAASSHSHLVKRIPIEGGER